MALTESKEQEKIILVTNDDGITAPGIAHLVQAVRHLGRVVIVAPDSPQSAMGHAITIGQPLRLEHVTGIEAFEGLEAWQCSGTPVDCVKLARDMVLGRRPDVCVSGVNHGANSSINVIYSGTMSAAMEAAIEGVPSAGFSLCDFSFEADFSVAASVAAQVTEYLLGDGMESGTLLNVNIPKITAADFRGIRVCRQALARWAENFERRTDPRGKDYFWMTGQFINNDHGTDTDLAALDAGYASVVPVTFDLTDHRRRSALEAVWGRALNR